MMEMLQLSYSMCTSLFINTVFSHVYILAIKTLLKRYSAM